MDINQNILRMKNQKKARYYYTYIVRKTKSIAMLLIPWPATADAASARRLDQCVTCANPLNTAIPQR